MNMRIVITDSGLGGLSVLAELENRLKEKPIYKNAELIFFNSLYSSDHGYNALENPDQKIIIFNNALNSIEKNYNPDLILIACNTLSVVYPKTEFATRTNIKVKGIVDSGVSQFENELKKKESKIILFGTATTINSDVYKNSLVKDGIGESQIINKACPDLETFIQHNPESKETRIAIKGFVKDVAKELDEIPKTVFAGLCCTHYGYSESLFFEALSSELNSEIKILNPNNRMLDFLFANSDNTFTQSNVSVKVVSQVKLKSTEIDSLSKILEVNAPKTAWALRNYNYIENLFDMK